MPTPKKPAPVKSPERAVDLNAARAARAEVDRDAPTLIVGDITLELPMEMPYNFLRRARKGDLDGAIASLLGSEEAAEKVFEQNLSMDDLYELVDQASEKYGVSEGK